MESDNAKCSINPGLRQGRDVGLASSSEVARAALAIIDTCVAKQGLGGVAIVGKSWFTIHL